MAHRPIERRVLITMARHVTYELLMLKKCAQEIANPNLTMFQNNLVVGGGLLHTRNLDDFFGTGAKGRPDDLIALDYTEKWTPQGVIDDDWRRAINKHLQHLTTVRAQEKRFFKFVVWSNRASALHNLLCRTVEGEDLELASYLRNPLKDELDKWTLKTSTSSDLTGDPEAPT